MAEKLVTLNGSAILYNDLRDRLKSVNADIDNLDTFKVDGAKVSDDGKYLYLTSNGDVVAGPYGPFSGGGGGGGGGTTTIMNLTNLSGWTNKTVPEGTDVFVDFNWSSTIDGVSTGLGTLSIMVETTVVKTMDIEQGDFTIKLNDYVTTGTNKITVTVTDSYDNARKSILKLSFVNYKITSDFDCGTAYNEAITYTYKPVGIGDKTVHFFMDGKEFETRVVTTSNREDSMLIPKQSPEYPEGFVWHGAHKFKLYFDLESAGETIVSNTLEYELICYDDNNTIPVITSSYAASSESMQYSNVVIPYYVFNTVSSYSNVELYIDNVLIQALPNVSRDLQTWTYRVTDVATHAFKIKSGVTERVFSIKVNKLDVDVHAETLELALHLSSENRSNDESEESRKTWQYTNPVTQEVIKAEFNDKFSWGTTDGWLKGDDGIPFLRLKDEDKITIPYQPFSVDKSDKMKQNGATFEFEFKISSVFDYDTDLISCYAGTNKIGFNITAQKAAIAGTISSISSQYKEEEHVRISFVINKLGVERFIYCYINGIISGVVQYNTEDSFIQDPPVNITIGSKDAVIDIYRIRCYQKALSRFQMVNNWIADMQNSEDLLKYYKENNVYDANDKVSLDKIKAATDGVLRDLPYLVVDIDTITDKKGNWVGHLPTYKGEKLLCNGYYVNPVDKYTSFSWLNGEIDVQGTSSQAYPIKNFKLKIKRSDTYEDPTTRKATDCSGFIMTEASLSTGKEVTFKKYSMRGWGDVSNPTKYKKPKSVETNTFVFKADFASSEGCNNVELVRYYNDVCTKNMYATPAQKGYGKETDPDYREGNDLVRQGIDGFPMIWFQNSNDTISFIGKYNFNNHKGTDEVYGFEYAGEEFEEIDDDGIYRTVEGCPDESWEVCDNNAVIALWKRVAGETTTTILKDKNGKTVTYDQYLKDENLTIMKTKTLSPVYEGTYDRTRLGQFVDLNKYDVWQPQWKVKYANVDEWITDLKITSVYDSGDTLTEEKQEQRAGVIELEKADIRVQFELTEETTQISPEDDMLGTYGKGESVAHAFEVRFPSEWYDTHTEGRKDGGENVKVDRFVTLQRWVTSTWPEKATNLPLETPQYGYEIDSADYRKAKFKNELDKYFDIKDTTFYYIFTETFLMIDSRVKNSFPTYFAITHEVEAKDPKDPTKYLYESTKEGDTAKEGVNYYKRTGEGTTESPYVYTLYPVVAGAPTVDDLGKPLFTRVLTRAESYDKNGWPLGRWCWLPYDMDTAIGINNEGLLVFTYSLEDTEGLKGDIVVPHTDPEGVPVFNGASSVFWNNFREQFQDKITADYGTLRAGAFKYIDPAGGDSIEKRYEDHQKMWPAAIFNEDAYYKYIVPLLETGENRLGMCLGSKEQQRKWWLFNRFRFLDSKYVAGDAAKYRISFRANAITGSKTIQITPYIDLYVKIKTGEGWESTPTKTYKNKSCSVYIPVESFGDTEAYIYSADQIKTIEGLNKSLAISTLDISTATNLQNLDVSGESKDKPNTTLVELHVGANKLLRTLNAKYCDYLGRKTEKFYSPSVDMKDCEQLEEAYFEGTQLNAVTLPSGGRIRKVHLPSTITTLNVENQYQINELKIIDADGTWNTSNITKLTIRNVNSVVQQTAIQIIEGMKTGEGTSTELTFTGFDITVPTTADVVTFTNKLKTFTKAALQGKITVTGSDAMSYSDYKSIKDFFGNDLYINCNVKKTVTFKKYDGSVVLDTQEVINKSEVAGSVTYGYGKTIDDPTKPETEVTYYDWAGWVDGEGKRYGETEHRVVEGVLSDLTLFSYFDELDLYTVNLYDYNGTTLLQTCKTINERAVPSYPTPNQIQYTGADPVCPPGFTAEWNGWCKVAYGSVDVESSADFRTIYNITANGSMSVSRNWEIVGLEISKQPNKINYYPNYDTFDPEGMEVTATKTTPDGHTKAVIQSTDYEIGDRKITTTTTQIRVYRGSIETFVNVYLPKAAAVTKDPNRGYQEKGQAPDFTGMEVTVTFTNDQTEIVSNNFRYDPPDFTSTTGIKNIYVLYKSVSCPYEVLVIDYVPGTLEECGWDLISYVCDKGKGRMYWDIGDEKSIEIRSTTLKYYSGTYYYRIIDFDHNIRYSKHIDPNTGDEYELDLGDDHIYEYETGKHTITFALAKKYMLLPDEEELTLTEIGCYGSTFHNNPPTKGTDPMAYEPTYSWHRGGVLKDSVVEYKNSLPESLRSKIKKVTKGQSDQDWTYIGPYVPGESEFWATKCLTQEDELFIPSLYEVFGINKPEGGSDLRTSMESTCCTRYEYYTRNDATFVKYSDADQKPYKWWLRSFAYCWRSSSESNPALYSNYDYVSTAGTPANDYNFNTNLVTFCFNV